MKALVYETPVATQDELEERIYEAATKIRTTPQVFSRLRENIEKRFQLCLDNEGNHFEHLM